MRERRLRGWFSIPAVAYDGSPSGLSADGRKLVLISPRKRFPRRRTTFAVVDTRTLTRAPPHRAAGRLQLRRDLPRRPDDVPDRVLVPGRSELRGAGPTTCGRGGCCARAVVDPRGARRGHEGNARSRASRTATAAGRTRCTTTAGTRSCTPSTPPAGPPYASTWTSGRPGARARAARRPAGCDGKGTLAAGEHRHRTHTVIPPPPATPRTAPPHAIRGREHELAAAGRADGTAAPHCRRPTPPPGPQERPA